MYFVKIITCTNKVKINLLQHKWGKALIAFSFYFAEGAPIGFIWWAMPTLLHKNNAPIEIIGAFTATLTLPWVFKFLWAPFIDVFRTEKFGYTKWIGVSQICMCLTLVPLIFIPLQNNYIIWGVFLFAHSICAATQDVSVDALVISSIAYKEKGMLNGYMQAGMLLGRSLFGGLALVLVPRIGLDITILCMILAILLIMPLLLFIKEEFILNTKENNLTAFRNNIKATFQSKQTWYALFFALTAAAAFESAGAMAGPFLNAKKINVDVIGFFFSIPVVLSMLIGGFFGGYFADKFPRKMAVTLLTFGFVFAVAAIAISEYFPEVISNFIWMSLFSIMYFFTGAFTAGSYAFFMDVTNPKIGATQFSTYMAAVNGCEAWTVFASGVLIAQYNYSIAFIVMCGISLFGLIFLRWVKI